MAAGLTETPPASATPDPHSSCKGPKGPKYGQRTFDDLLKNDRRAVRRTLNKLMDNFQWKAMKVEKRKAAVARTISDELKERKANRTLLSATSAYPGQFDVKREIEFFLHVCASRIAEPTEEDDPESDSELAGGRRIKKENYCEDDESDAEQSETSAEGEVNGGEDAEDDEEDEKDKTCTFKIVSRGLVIQSESVRVGCFAVKVEAKPLAAAKSSAGYGKVMDGRVAKIQDWKSVKRSWKFIDGKMASFP